MLLEARQVLISGFCWKKPGLLPAPLLSILAGSLAGWRGAASFELFSPQFFSRGDSWGFQDPSFWACQVACCKTWSPDQAGYKTVIPLHRKLPNSWCSFFCKTDLLLGLYLVSSFPYVDFECLGVSNVTPFSFIFLCSVSYRKLLQNSVCALEYTHKYV